MIDQKPICGWRWDVFHEGKSVVAVCTHEPNHANQHYDSALNAVIEWQYSRPPVSDDVKLEADVTFHSWPITPRGGQHVGVPNGILAIHRPSGLAAVSVDQRSQMQNRKEALRLLETARAGLDDRERIEGLRRHADANGGVTITIWANEMWEVEGVFEDSDEGEVEALPLMFDSLNDLLDHLSAATKESTTPSDKSTARSGQAPSSGESR